MNEVERELYWGQVEHLVTVRSKPMSIVGIIITLFIGFVIGMLTAMHILEKGT